jgi:hypothetical protein
VRVAGPRTEAPLDRGAFFRDLVWLQRQPPAVRAAYVAALARFDPPVPEPWRTRLQTVAEAQAA